jgi:hypothetical protein
MTCPYIVDSTELAATAAFCSPSLFIVGSDRHHHGQDYVLFFAIDKFPAGGLGRMAAMLDLSQPTTNNAIALLLVCCRITGSELHRSDTVKWQIRGHYEEKKLW